MSVPTRDGVTPPAEAGRSGAAALTRAVLGRSLSFAELERYLEEIEIPERNGSELADPSERIWVGSIGYERFPDNGGFAKHLRRHGVERLIDVRELPISRRRGYAKTALGEALAQEGIEYVHMKGLGNPKPIRELYKSGRVEEGRRRYREHLRGVREKELEDLRTLLTEKPTALMCVEHDQGVCHREVIIEALEQLEGLDVEIARLG